MQDVLVTRPAIGSPAVHDHASFFTAASISPSRTRIETTEEPGGADGKGKAKQRGGGGGREKENKGEGKGDLLFTSLASIQNLPVPLHGGVSSLIYTQADTPNLQKGRRRGKKGRESLPMSTFLYCDQIPLVSSSSRLRYLAGGGVSARAPQLRDKHARKEEGPRKGGKKKEKKKG